MRVVNSIISLGLESQDRAVQRYRMVMYSHTLKNHECEINQLFLGLRQCVCTKTAVNISVDVLSSSAVKKCAA